MRYFPTALCLSALCLLALAGCRTEEGITQEDIPQPEREELRLRVAILEHNDYILFIRIDGPTALVTKHQKEFDDFVLSTRFPEKKDETIQWTEPKGWKKDPPIKGRDATYRIDAKPKELEVKISRLPSKGYRLLPNMHRWQKQIDMPLSEDLADAKQFIKEDELGKRKLTWVELKGLGVHTVSKPLDPKDQQKDFMPGLQQEEQDDEPFKYKAPDNWVKKPLVEFALDVYEVTDGRGNTAQVTITKAGGDLQTNISRWRGQVGLPPLARGELSKVGKTLVVGGIKSFYADINNPDGPKKEKNRILGVIVPVGNTKYFIKMTGPSEFVGQQKQAFETFVESFKK